MKIIYLYVDYCEQPRNWLRKRWFKNGMLSHSEKVRLDD